MHFKLYEWALGQKTMSSCIWISNPLQQPKSKQNLNKPIHDTKDFSCLKIQYIVLVSLMILKKPFLQNLSKYVQYSLVTMGFNSDLKSKAPSFHLIIKQTWALKKTNIKNKNKKHPQLMLCHLILVQFTLCFVLRDKHFPLWQKTLKHSIFKNRHLREQFVYKYEHISTNLSQVFKANNEIINVILFIHFQLLSTNDIITVQMKEKRHSMTISSGDAQTSLAHPKLASLLGAVRMGLD